MNTYIAIITTALVLTQIIRCVQNAITLYRHNIVFKKQLKELADAKITEKDFATQRKAYRLIVEYLEHRPTPHKETVYCKDCENLMFSDCYGECAKAHKGIVRPDDTCEHGIRRNPKGE